MTKNYFIGQTVRLPDGPTVKLTEIAEGVEHGLAIFYLTGINSLGQSVTRWVAR
jgi:hypothetical protein